MVTARMISQFSVVRLMVPTFLPFRSPRFLAGESFGTRTLSAQISQGATPTTLMPAARMRAMSFQPSPPNSAAPAWNAVTWAFTLATGIT